MTWATGPRGSRRTDEVWPRRYSPDARPSSTRAAPAKKRSWSTATATSSDRVSPSGLPVFSTSTSASSWADSSTRSASFSSDRWRSDGVVQRWDSKARAAAANAASTSASPELGDVAYTSPVAGFTTSSTSPEALDRSSPSMTLTNVVFSDACSTMSGSCRALGR